MISPADALDIVLERAKPLEPILLPVEKALGHCLAQDVRSDRDLPPADRSAMDGYAVCSGDLPSCPRELRLSGEVAAGSPARPRVRPGGCVRILTGANVPPGADAVVMVEQTRERDGIVTVLSPVSAGANILHRAEDARKGETLLRRGTPLGAMQVGVCAAVGAAELRVHRRPRVALLCTGEELREARDKVRAHEVRNSNGPALSAALETWGYGAVKHRVVRDELGPLTVALRRAIDRRDVVLITGGMSRGKYDFVRQAVETLGATVRFHGVAMKPGKPILYAALPGNRHLFGLPGNPLSAMTGLFEFALPALRRLSGFSEKVCRPVMRVPLASRITSKGGRVRFMLARLLWQEEGPRAEAVVSHSSADLVAGGKADGVIVVAPEVRELDAGVLVEFHLWRPLP